MALHRDIYWLGRQWAVTGFGLQAIDQRLKGAFDIEGAKLWEEGAFDGLRAQPWLNASSILRRYLKESRCPSSLPTAARIPWCCLPWPTT